MSTIISLPVPTMHWLLRGLDVPPQTGLVRLELSPGTAQGLAEVTASGPDGEPDAPAPTQLSIFGETR